MSATTWRTSCVACAALWLACSSGNGTPAPVPPSAPASLTATAGDGSVTLTWAVVADATSYKAYYATTAGVLKGTGTPISGLLGTQHTVAGLANGTTYFFVVTAVGPGGESAESVERSARPLPPPPPAPAGLTASAGNGSVWLTWPAVAGATTYKAYYATTAGVLKGTGTGISSLPSSPYSVTGLVNGTTYYFVVTAVGMGGESAESPERSARPTTALTPPAPGGLRATPGNAEVTVSWDGTAGAASYNLYWSTTTGVTHLTGTRVTGAVSPQAVTGLTNDTTYYFVVTGVSGNGEGAESLEVSARPSATPPPAAPTGLSAAGGDHQLTLAWTPSAGATSYAVYYGTAQGISKASATRVAPASSPQVVTGLANFTSYYVVVTAIGAGGESAESREVQVATVAPGTTFAQADLTGDWDALQLTTNAFPRWGHTHLGIAADGAVTLRSILENGGPVTPPTTFDMKLAISSDGTVTNSGLDGSAAFRGSMTSTKTLIFATDTEGNGAHDLFVIRKRVPGVTFSSADLANVAFAYHGLTAGGWWGWEYGDGTTDSGGALTINHSWEASGSITPPAPGFLTLTIDAAGVVGYSGAPGVMSGVMSADKKSLFLLQTSTAGPPPEVQLVAVVLTRTGFTSADLEGRYAYQMLSSGSSTATSGWNRGVAVMNSAGAVTALNNANNVGGTSLPGPYTVTIDAGGNVTRADDASYHGHMAWHGDFSVRTVNAPGNAASGALMLSAR